MKKRPRRLRDQRGAELVEFALIVPVLVLLLFGAIDFGWAFSQNLSVKHAAREGARLAAVNADNGGGCTALMSMIDQRVNTELKSSKITVSISFPSGVKGQIGDTGTITVTYPLSSLSGVTTQFMGGTMSSSVEFRMEQDADWVPNAGGTYSCP